MKRIPGRPRQITDAQVKAIMRWHTQIKRLERIRCRIPTQRQLCKTLGLTAGTIYYVIRMNGRLVQPAPVRA